MIRVAGLLLLLLCTCVPAQGNERVSWLNDAGTGQFLLRGNDGALTPATLLHTKVQIRVNGPVAEVTVTQHFRNPGQAFREGIYVYPMPDNAAIHGMDMYVGSRHIAGEIHEKAKARKIYEKAKNDGKRAGLVEQQRPNLFTTSVANIAAGEQVEVRIHYSQVLDRNGRTFSLRLPLTITPRYQSPDPEHFRALDLDPDTGKPPAIIPKSIVESALKTAHLPAGDQQVAITAHINAGMPVTQLVSRSHDIHTAYDGKSYTVTLAHASVPMDRDFRLSWTLDPQAGGGTTFFSQTVDGDHYGLLMLMPPAPEKSRTTVPKEQILVIDQSGSMEGTRIKQARLSLVYALRQLDRNDRFNVVAFNDHYKTLFPQPVPATPDNIHKALAFVHNLQAGGGTEMLPALKAALAMKADPEHLRQVIFVTDGAIDNENALLQTISDDPTHARIFPVGIGAAPNTFLMRRMAQLGRGSYTFIGDSGEVQAKMSALLDRISRPVLSDIQVQLPKGVTGEMSPAKIPDLYLGEPVVVAMKLNRIPQSIVVRGRNPQPWTRRITVNPDREDAGVAGLWARDRIRALMARLIQGGKESTIRPQVVKIALKHHLVSRYTSFVAVDRTPVRRPGEPLHTDEISPPLPKDMQTPARGFPSTALDTGPQYLLAALLALFGVALLWLAREKHRVGA